MAWSTPISKVTGDLVNAADWNTNTVDNPTSLRPAAIEAFFDGGGAVLQAGKQIVVEVPFKCTVDGVRLLASPNQIGTVQIDAWKNTYANYPPTNSNSITGSATPRISNAIKFTDTSLTGWTTEMADQDILIFNIDSSPTPDVLTWCLIVLDLSRS